MRMMKRGLRPFQINQSFRRKRSLNFKKSKARNNSLMLPK
eukprot:UN10592